MNLENLTEKVAEIGSKANILGLLITLLAGSYTFLAYNKLDTLKEVGRQVSTVSMDYSKYEKRVDSGYYYMFGGLSLSVLGIVTGLPRDLLEKRKRKMKRSNGNEQAKGRT